MTASRAGHLAMLLFSMLVAGSFSLGALAANEIAPLALNAVRFWIACGIIGIAAFATTGIARTALHAPWRYVLMAAFFTTYFVLMFEGLKTAPREIPLMAGARDRDITLKLGNLAFQPGAGAPHATDRVRGRRPGDATSFNELIKLTQHFDVLHMLPPLIEPQDVAMHLRHYMTLKSQLTLSDKVPFVFSRGTPQVMDSFEMLRDFRGLSDAEL